MKYDVKSFKLHVYKRDCSFLSLFVEMVLSGLWEVSKFCLISLIQNFWAIVD